MPNKRVELIAEQQWLDTVGERIQERMHAVYDSTPTGRKAKSILQGHWLGHPLHAALSDVPLGAWTVALALDACEMTTGLRPMGVGADAAVNLGLLGAAASAVTGWADWSETDGRARRIGLAHGLLGIASIACFAASSLARNKNSRRLGRGLSLMGYAAAIVSGSLGGHLVFGEGVGVATSSSDPALK